jgi:hypothetical protein
MAWLAPGPPGMMGKALAMFATAYASARGQTGLGAGPHDGAAGGPARGGLRPGGHGSWVSQ